MLGKGFNVAYPFRNRRWEVTLCTRGGNQSWNGLVKYLEPTRCDYLFVLVGDGREWHEVDPGAPLQSDVARRDVRVVKGDRL